LKRRGLIAAVLALVAVPALAQYSDSYNFLKAVRSRDTETAMALVADPRSTAINARGSDGDGALHILVRSRSQTDLTWIVYFLSRGARPDLQNRDGDTPLMLAARAGWIEAAEALLARGANINLANGRGETPLIRAVQLRDIAMVRVLIANGADPSHTDSVAGYSALDYARRDTRAAAILRVLEAPRPARRTAGPTR
jgi:ankyrin repeat protein